MKSISLALISFLTISSQIGFAETTNNAEVCCPVVAENVSNQQAMLDQIQAESEKLINSSSSAAHNELQKKVSENITKESEMLNTIQQESHSITVDALMQLTAKVNQHVSNASVSAR